MRDYLEYYNNNIAIKTLAKAAENTTVSYYRVQRDDVKNILLLVYRFHGV